MSDSLMPKDLPICAIEHRFLLDLKYHDIWNTVGVEAREAADRVSTVHGKACSRLRQEFGQRCGR